MGEFNEYVIQMFMFRWSAEFYAWRARRRGYTTVVSSMGNGLVCIALGGRWSVNISSKQGLKVGEHLL